MAGFTTDEVYDILSNNNFYQFPVIASDDILDLIMPISDLSENQGSTLSNDQFLDIGSSSGSNNWTLNYQTTANINQNIIPWSTDATQETLDFPVVAENGLCSWPAYNPTTLETGTSSVGIDQPQSNQSYNSVISQAQYISESSESSPINYINMMEQGPSSFNQLLQGGPEPYFPTMDSFGLCTTLDESNLHIPRDEQNSGQDFIVSDYLINEYPESTIVGSHNICQEQVDLNPHSEVAQSTYMEQEINWVQPNQQHTYSVIAPQTNNMIFNLPNKRSGLINHGTPSFLDAAARNNNFRNKNSQISNQYQSSSPQDSSELLVGNVNERQSSIPYQQQALWPSNEHSIFNILSRQSELQKSYDVQAPFGERQNSYNFFDSQNPMFSRARVQMPPNIPNPLLDSYHIQSSAPSRLWLPFSSKDDVRPNQVPAVMTSTPTSFNDISSRFNRFNWPDSKPSRTTTSYDYPHTLYQGPFRMPNLIEMLEPVTLAPKDYVITESPPRSSSSSSSVLCNRGSLSSSNSFTSHYQNSMQPDPRFVVDRHQKAHHNSQLHEDQSRLTTPGTQMYANRMLPNSLLSRHQDSLYTNTRTNAGINDSTSLFSQELNSQTDKRKGKQKAVDYSSPFVVGESWCPSTSYKGKYLSPVSDDPSTIRVDHFREKYPQDTNIAPRLARNDAYDFAYEARDGSNKRMRLDKY